MGASADTWALLPVRDHVSIATAFCQQIGYFDFRRNYSGLKRHFVPFPWIDIHGNRYFQGYLLTLSDGVSRYPSFRLKLK
jgi:hypothetical protein